MEYDNVVEFLHAKQGLPHGFTLAQLHRSLVETFRTLPEDNEWHALEKFTVRCINDIVRVYSKHKRMMVYFRISGDIQRSIDAIIPTKYPVTVLMGDDWILGRLDSIKLSWKKRLGIVEILITERLAIIYLLANIVGVTDILLRLISHDELCMTDQIINKLLLRLYGHLARDIPASENFVRKMRAFFATHEGCEQDIRERFAASLSPRQLDGLKEFLPELVEV